MEGSTSFHVLLVAAFLILLQFMSSCSAARAIPSKTNTEFIKTSCDTTNYPQLCYTSLSSYASKIQTSPKLLANTALSVTLNTTRSTSVMMTKLSKTRGLSPNEAAAVSDCIEEMSDAVDELQMSMGEMGNSGGSNYGLKMNDIQTWVSAALTNEDTCMEGFAEISMNGNVKNQLSQKKNVKNQVRSHIVKAAHMTSNALALLNNYASAHSIMS